MRIPAGPAEETQSSGADYIKDLAKLDLPDRDRSWAPMADSPVDILLQPIFRGETQSSNPLPSSGESGENTGLTRDRPRAGQFDNGR